MSLILKGIDLPEEEETISLMIEPDGTVSFYVWDSTENDKLTSDGRTNAIQIPTPHGRLIDADKVFCYNFWDEQNIDNAPTILEAEEADENQV